MSASSHHRIFSTFAIAFSLVPGVAMAAQVCLPLDLGTLGGPSAIARGVNNSGVVVGDSLTPNGDTHAFKWQSGVMTDLGTLPGGIFSTAAAVNTLGIIAGMSMINGSFEGAAAVTWNAAGAITILPPLNGATSNQAIAINSQGKVVGSSGGYPVLWANGTVTALSTTGRATAINSVGEVALTGIVASGAVHAQLWRNGTLIDLGTLGGSRSSAEGINNAGQVVGQSTTSFGQTHAFVWDDGVMTDLGALGNYSFAREISASGLMTGEGQTDLGTRALLWGRDGVVVSLGALPGASSSSGFAINGRGDVAGTSFLNGFSHAVLWEACASYEP